MPLFPVDRSPAALGSALAVLLLVALPAALGGCKRGGGEAPGGQGSAAPTSSAAPSGAASAGAGAAATGSAGAAAAGAPGADQAAPQGSGVTEFLALSATAACQPKDVELGSYLQRNEVTVSAREGGIAAAWMVQLPNRPDAQVAFGAWDPQAKPLARVRGIGLSREHAPRVFPTGSEWTVAWFDSEGLSFTRPPMEMGPAPVTGHLGAVKEELAADVALASTPAGPLVAVAPFGEAKNQLGVFLFAPTDPSAPPVRALGVSRHAKTPKTPAVAADQSGYYFAWIEEGGAILASRFDLEGKEGEGPSAVAPAAPDRKDLTLVATGAGAIVIWSEGDTILARGLSARAQPAAPPQVVVKGGKWPRAAVAGEGALVCWIGQPGQGDGQVLVTRLSATGAPSGKGLALTEPGRAVKDPAACAVAGSRAAFVWMEPMSATVSTKRAVLRTIEASCVP